MRKGLRLPCRCCRTVGQDEWCYRCAVPTVVRLITLGWSSAVSWHIWGSIVSISAPSFFAESPAQRIADGAQVDNCPRRRLREASDVILP